MPQTRRTFLKASGLAVIGSAAKAQAGLNDAPQPTEVPRTSAQSSRVEGVNLLQGTDSTPAFSRGNTLPIAALPFGMAHWTLQSHSGTPWMFQPGARRIQGFRCTHQLSPWIADYGQAVFLPFSGDLNSDPEARAASYRLEEAQLSPHSLRMRLIRYRANAELVPTERCCVLDTRFDEVAEHGLLIEVPASSVSITPDATAQTIRFVSSVNEGGVPPGFGTYYVLRFATSWERFELVTEGGRTVGVVRFAPAQIPSMRVEIGTSFLSFEQAERNLANEVGGRSTQDLRQSAAAVWNRHFERLTVEGGSASQHRIFDSCFYRALLFPRVWHELDAGGKPHHRSPYNGNVLAGVMYADHGYWDVYRAWYPFMSLCFPERLGEILQAWVNAYREGGWLPQFPCPGYRACMTGSLIDAVFADAAVKEVPGFDLAAAYEGLKKHATTAGDPDKGYGRRGIEQYLRLGYAPAGKVDQSVAETTDAAYGDFCISQVARVLGRHEDAAVFLARSDNWKHIFDQETKFFRGKTEQGSWLTPFDPITWGDPYVEGSAWQHRFDVPHDLSGLIEAYGGSKSLIDALEQMLHTAADFNIGIYGREIHEMSEMAAVPFGQYAHGNQPVHHVLYLFAAAGRPDRTQYWARRVMEELYSEVAFAGDEDTGSMSAWFLLSAIGLYPLCPGKPEFTLGSPLFERATVSVPGRKSTVITAAGNAPSHVYVNSISLNGKPHRQSSVAYATIAAGAELRFAMSPTPDAG